MLVFLAACGGPSATADGPELSSDGHAATVASTGSGLAETGDPDAATDGSGMATGGTNADSGPASDTTGPMGGSSDSEDTGAPPEFQSECLGRPGPHVKVDGVQLEPFREDEVPDGTVFDASDASWTGLDAGGEPIPWTVTFRNGGTGVDSCWFGGRIQGPWDDTAEGITWEEPYHHAGGMTIDIANFLVEGVRIHNQGDGIRPYGANAIIRAAYLTDIHDDCIENDDVYSVTVEDSLLDGCYVAFSARPYEDNPPDGSDNLWEVKDSLVRLEPQPTVYKGPAPGHGPFFKWDADGNSPRVSVHDTIFRADQVPNHGELGLPEGLVMESCSNNTMVWLGEGEFPDPLPRCFTITTDVGVWDDAVADWHAAHPDIAQ